MQDYKVSIYEARLVSMDLKILSIQCVSSNNLVYANVVRILSLRSCGRARLTTLYLPLKDTFFLVKIDG